MAVVDLATRERLRERLEVQRSVADPAAVRAFRPDIQGLRAVAVVLVVLYHAGVPFLPGGFVGVDVFFVISGYLITSHLLGELRATGRLSFGEFYARRVKRLLPMAAVVIMASLAATWVLTSSLQTRDLATDSLWAGLFAMNIHLARDGVDYQAADGSTSALLHFWSLAIEEQFYVFWPVLLMVFSLGWWRAHRRAETGSGELISIRTLTVVIMLATSASFAYCLHETAVAQSLSYFVTPARAWELTAGGLIAINAAGLARRRWLQSDWLMVTGLLAIIGSAVLLTDASAFPGWRALIPVLGSASMIIAGLSSTTRTERAAFAHPAVQGLGKISYGLYLWHWPMLVLAPAYLGVDQLTLVQSLVVVGVAVWLSTISFLGLEDPLRRVRGWSSGRAFTLGAALTALIVVTSLAAALWIPPPKATGNYARPVTATANLQRAIALAALHKTIPSNVQPALVRADRDKPRATTGDGVSCMVDLLTSTLARQPNGTCTYGDPQGARTVVLTGDSHAYQWFPALESMARARHWRLINLTKSGCPLYDVRIFSSFLKRDYRECYSWRWNALRRISQESPDLIITSAFTGSVNRDRSYTRRWVQGEGETIARLRSTGAKVVVIGDTPYPRVDVPECLALHILEATRCAIPTTVALSDPERRRLGAAEAIASGATLIDPVAWFCTPASCPAIVGNTIVYVDNSHMTATYALLLRTRLERALPVL